MSQEDTCEGKAVISYAGVGASVRICYKSVFIYLSLSAATDLLAKLPQCIEEAEVCDFERKIKTLNQQPEPPDDFAERY